MRALTQPVRTSLFVRRMSSVAMALKFPVYPPSKYDTSTNEPVKRPKEFACFSYDEHRRFHLGDRSLKWYYPPTLGVDLSEGYERFDRHDDRIDEHLDALLRTIADHEQKTGEAIDAQIVTWRGMLTKIMAAPFDKEAFEMNATLYRDCIFIEENHEFWYRKQMVERKTTPRGSKDRPTLPMMQYWGYKFETLSTIPRPWGETSREEIENREHQIVNNKEQYCSVVRTGFGNTIVCLGGEVDAIWDVKPETPGDPVNWVELKTSAEIVTYNDQFRFDRKLMKYWIQSFLLGVPKIIVGFRSKEGILQKIEEFQTLKLPYEVQGKGRAKWDGNVCIKFTTLFLEWLRLNVTDEGVWRIRRAPGADFIELFRVEEVGHGDIVSDEFMNWRIKLEFRKSKAQEQAQQSESEPTPEPAAAAGS